MAALRIFARSVITPIKQFYNNDYTALYTFSLINHIDKRFASFKTSPIYNENTKYTDFEISRDPIEWNYVKRLFKPKYIPCPPRNLEVSASGWKSPRDEAKKLPYFVNRTKNHMLPVYIHRRNRNIRRITVIRKIDGDIVALEADLKKFIVDSTQNKNVATQIIEPGGILKLRGEHANIVKVWLDKHGF